MQETRIFPRPTPRGPPNALLHESVLTVRFFQHASLNMALFIALYFVYWHVLLRDPVPTGLIVLIGAVVSALTLSHCGTLSHNLFPESSTVLPWKGSIIQVLLLSMGLLGLRSVEYIGAGKTDDWFKPIRENNGYASLKPAGVEEHHAVLGSCVLWLTGGGLFLTGVLAGLAIWRANKTGTLNVMLPKMRQRGQYMPVGEVDYEFDEESTVCDGESVKSA